MTIADRIRNRRIELGLSVDDLAKLLQKNRATVYRYESNYIKTNNKKNYQIYKQINITIFVVAFFIYLYFLYRNYKNVSELKKTISNNKKVLYAQLNLIAAILFLVGGILYLYTESNDIDVEVGI